MHVVKCVVVGDNSSEKTSLLLSFVGKLHSEYVHTVFDNEAKMLEIRGEMITLGLFDTAGHEDYARLRPLSYPHTDVFLICFSVVSSSSFENVRLKCLHLSSQWVPEISFHCPRTPFLLVGTQTDLRDGGLEKMADDQRRAVTRESGEKLARELKAVDYVECSALTKTN